MVGNNIGGSVPKNFDQCQEHVKTTEQPDQLLPIANVGRIMKQILPSNAKVSKEAKQTMQECVSEFISFVTGEASDKCRKERRKTVTGDDICWALGTLGLDNYAGPLRRYLDRYRDQEGAELRANGSNNNIEDELKLLADLSTAQEQRFIMIMNQEDNPRQNIQET
ncbi:transcriptional activator hap3-like [Argentina anserina]|uniref:transcriptional activator hap3-like n=1 Tax=Argentina anserina TaxID=57926 RepID=UPI002176502C|nr:transcriptional activator hap3-like [Potentilla anserina]